MISDNGEPTVAEKPTTKDVDSAKTDTITISAMGDIMFGSNFPDMKDFPPNDGENLLEPFAKYFNDTDITFGNVEGVFLNSGGTPKGKGSNIFCFRQPEKLAGLYKKYGFNLLSIANNHMADFGQTGIESTDRTLSELAIAFAGSKSRPTAELTVKGISVGFAAFAPHNGSVDMNDIANAEATVKDLKSRNKIVIVSFHGGGEGEKFQHVPKKTEIFYGQNRGNVYEFAHRMVDAGADLVIGHGPHVVRAQELYKNKFIAYSLGNFCTYGKFSLKGPNANAPMLKLKLNSSGDFISGEIISGKQLGEGGPVLDEAQTAFYKIKELSSQDFPDSPLVFENGKISKK